MTEAPQAPWPQLTSVPSLSTFLDPLTDPLPCYRVIWNRILKIPPQHMDISARNILYNTDHDMTNITRPVALETSNQWQSNRWSWLRNAVYTVLSCSPSCVALKPPHWVPQTFKISIWHGCLWYCWHGQFQQLIYQAEYIYMSNTAPADNQDNSSPLNTTHQAFSAGLISSDARQHRPSIKPAQNAWWARYVWINMPSSLITC